MNQPKQIRKVWWLAPALTAAVIVAGPAWRVPGAAATLSVPSSHPRLWFNATRINLARQWYSRNPFNPPGDGTAVEYVARAAKYVMTGDASVCQPAVNWASTMVPTDWNDNLNSDQVRWNGEAIALVYDWCYPLWSSSQRSTTISNWNTYYSFNMNNPAWGYTNMQANNYFWGNIRNAFEWGVATSGENASAQTFIDHALDVRWPAFLNWANSVGKGGVFEEGSGYGMYMARYPVVPLLSAPLYGRNLLTETNFYREAVMNMIYQTTPSATASKKLSSPEFQVLAFNDDQYFSTVDYDNNFTDFMAGMAQAFASVPIGQYARQWLQTTGATVDQFISAVDPGGTALSYNSLPLDYFASGPGYLYSRTNWGSTGTYMQVQGGAGGGLGHWHADYGNFHLWRNGYWLTKESTGYSDTFTGWGNSGSAGSEKAEGHNVIFVNGRGPIFEYPAAVTTITRLESTSQYSYMVSDLTRAMRSNDPRYDNSSAGTTVREYLFIRPLETLVLFDRIQTPLASTAKGIGIHFENNPAVNGKKVVGVNGNQALEVNAVLPGSPSVRVVNEGSAGRYRLELETSGAAQTYFLTVLQARDSSGPGLAITSSEDGSSVTLNLQHPSLGAARVVFTKAATSTGGQFGYSSSGSVSSLASLAAGVQSVTVSDNGVTWAGGGGGGGTPPPPPPAAPTAPSGLRILR